VILRGAAGGLGLALLVAGAVFFGQGMGWIGGSFMSGSTKWAVVGGLVGVAGFGLLAAARFRSR
jgi:hypothetical protein